MSTDVTMGATEFGRAQKTKDVGVHQLPGQLLLEEDCSEARWFECAPAWPSPTSGGIRTSTEKWRNMAEQTLESTSRMYDKRVASSGRKDIQKVLNREKTLADKIAAATLVVQESPLHRLDELHTLFSTVKKKGRGEKSLAIDAFKDLLINDLLPDDRRLLKFEERDFNCGPHQISKRHLSYALFEDELKNMYTEFLNIIEECGQDTVSHFKEKSVSVTFALLAAKPENEKRLLSMLVNKLGDPERKVASNASYYLRLLVEKHPQMKLVLLYEVEQLMHRKNVGRKALYYAVSFLNQLQFGKDDVEIAQRLVSLYMEVVTQLMNEEKGSKKERTESSMNSKESRIMGALLTGVNRAFPFTDPASYDPSLSPQYDTLFRIAHAKSPMSSAQALSFLLQLSKWNSTVSDRFYRALYSRTGQLVDSGESKVPIFLNLIYKAMKSDISAKRVRAFAKRILQTALQTPSSLTGGILVLLSEVLAEKHPIMLKASTTLPESNDADENFKDVDSDKETNEEEMGEEIKKTGHVKPRHDESSYKIDAREPLHAHAERSAMWELVGLASHVHPSVQKFSLELCTEQKKIEYASDPLTDFTLMAFLDKFSFKNPKKRVCQSLHGKRSVQSSGSLSKNIDKFFDSVRKGEETEEDAFFGRFFQINPSKLDSIEGKGVGDDVPNIQGDASGSDSEEEAFEKAMHEEMRRLSGGIPEGVDVDDDDPDELAAFDDAFKDEMEADNDGDMEEVGRLEASKQSGKSINASVFAAAEDFAEAIENCENEHKLPEQTKESERKKRRSRTESVNQASSIKKRRRRRS